MRTAVFEYVIWKIYLYHYSSRETAVESILIRLPLEERVGSQWFSALNSDFASYVIHCITL
jgi:hypothetical protein